MNVDHAYDDWQLTHMTYGNAANSTTKPDGLHVIARGTGTNDKTFYTLPPNAIGGIIARDENGTK